jgi:hypothetical protein
MVQLGDRMEVQPLLRHRWSVLASTVWATAVAWSGSDNSSFSGQITLNQVKNWHKKNIDEFICHLNLSVLSSCSSLMDFSVLGHVLLSVDNQIWHSQKSGGSRFSNWKVQFLQLKDDQNLYIKASVVYLTSWTYMHVMHVFPGRYGWISLKKQKKSALKDQMMEPNWRFEVPMMKPSLRWSKRIYETHNWKLRWGSYDRLKMREAAKLKVS